MRKITYAQALNEAVREEMQRDSRVFIYGEDVGLLGGVIGSNKRPIRGVWRGKGSRLPTCYFTNDWIGFMPFIPTDNFMVTKGYSGKVINK